MAANNSSSSTCESNLTEVTADSAHFAGSTRLQSGIQVASDPFIDGHDNYDEEIEVGDVEELNRQLLILARILPTVPELDEVSILEGSIDSILQLQEKIHVLEQELRKTGGAKAKFHSNHSRSN